MIDDLGLIDHEKPAPDPQRSVDRRQIMAGRVLAGLSQAQLTDAANLSKCAVHKVERSDGDPADVAAVVRELERRGVSFPDGGVARDGRPATITESGPIADRHGRWWVVAPTDSFLMYRPDRCYMGGALHTAAEAEARLALQRSHVRLARRADLEKAFGKG